MAYIGQPPFQDFTSVPTKDSFTGDGSTTTFDLANDVVRGAENALEVFIDNEDGSNDVFIVKNATIPAGSSLEVMSGNKLVLQNDGSNGDNLEALASAASAVDITVSVLEDV